MKTVDTLSFPEIAFLSPDLLDINEPPGLLRCCWVSCPGTYLDQGKLQTFRSPHRVELLYHKFQTGTGDLAYALLIFGKVPLSLRSRLIESFLTPLEKPYTSYFIDSQSVNFFKVHLIGFDNNA